MGKVGVAVAVGGPELDTSDAGKMSALAEAGTRVAMHIAVARPQYLDEASIPAAVVEEERALIMQSVDPSKPPAVAEKIVSGRMRKFFSESCLVHQECLTDEEGRSVTAYLKAAAGGTPVTVQSYACFVAGEAEDR